MKALRELTRLEVDVVHANKLTDLVEKSFASNHKTLRHLKAWSRDDERCGEGRRRGLFSV